jgi:hypothetical protein
MNSNYRIAATLYSLETWFFLRYLVVNTLHEGDDADNNNNNNNNYYYYYYCVLVKLQVHFFACDW